MKRWAKRLACGVLALLLAAATGMTAANFLIFSCAQYTSDRISDLPTTHCAILLGTSKWMRRGMVNLYYKYRLEAAEELYRNKKCKKIIVSGDNATMEYNEPMTMKRDLVKMGVSWDDVICDYAGFRTLDSIIRFKEVFGQTKGIVVSQKFHNTRAVYIGRSYGIELHGYNARDVSLRSGLKTRAREFFSKVKCVLDVHLLYTQPKFLGEKINVGEDAAEGLPPEQK